MTVAMLAGQMMALLVRRIERVVLLEVFRNFFL